MSHLSISLIVVRVDDNWEEWEMKIIASNLQAWLKRNKCEDGQKSHAYMGQRRNKERSYYGDEGKPKQTCIFRSEEHWSDECRTVTQAQRILCFNCCRSGHRGGAAKKLNLKPKRHEVREIVTLSGVTKEPMPIYEIAVNALDGKARERIKVTGSKL